MPSFPQLGLGSDPSVDLGFGLNLSRLCGTNSNGNQQAPSVQSSNGTNSSGTMGEATNLEIMQRINAMLENSLDLSNLTGEVAAKRNYSDSLSMSDLFSGFSSNGNNGNQIVSQQDDVLANLLQQHQLNQALKQHQLEQQNQMKSFSPSSLFLNKNEGHAMNKLIPNSSNNNQPSQRSMSLSQHRQSMASSGLGDSPTSSASSPVANGQPRTTRSQSTGGFSSSMQPGIHSTPTSCCRPIRGTSLFRDSSSPTLEQVLLMGCQRGHDGQGTSSTESDLSMLSSSGISSVESSLTELMQSLNMSGSSNSGVSTPSVNPFSNQGLQQQLSYQQQQALQNSKLQAALQQNGLAQLGSLTGNDMSPQSLQTLQTNLQNLQELANLQNLQAWQNLRNLQSLQAIAGNANGLSSLLSGAPGSGVDRNALNAVESALQSSWSPSLSAAALGLSTGSFNTPSQTDGNSNLERAARMYRNAASLCEPTCTWSGHLPPRAYKNATYSCKVFLGGVPWDITEVSLTNAFKQFGAIKVEWPGKDNVANPPKGYVYIIFDNEKHVKSLLQACTHDYSNGGSWYYKISSRRMRSKEVQVIPWMLSDSNYVRSPTQRLDPQKTVFVGALHGMLNAEGLAHIMNDLFGGVLYAGIDTDKFKYPIGSGRVTFNNNRSYMKAVAAAFIEIKTPKFTKKVQVDPYLEDSLCATCGVQQGPYFCRDLACFKYFCRSCWQWQHNSDMVKHHRPLMRHYKGAGNVNGSNGSPVNNASSPIAHQHQQTPDLPQPDSI